jgi:hypothetical protein
MIAQIGIVSSQLDYDALAFISAAGITDQTQVIAINDLTRSLKLTGIWSKMKAIYPFVGGTAGTHKWNLKDPRDVDAAYRLSFTGTWTHSSNGAEPNGTNAFANTFLNPRNNLTNAELVHLSYYSRTDSAFSTEICIGCSDGTGATGLWIRRSTNGCGISYDTQTGNATHYVGTGTVTNSLGLFLGVLTSTDILFYSNNTSVALTKINNRNINRQNRPLYLGAQNAAGTASNFSNKQCAFASIGTTLTSQNATDFYNAVNQFQITLGRNV